MTIQLSGNSMPAFTVLIDGVSAATVCADGYDVISVHIGGTRADDAPAFLDMSGSRHSDGSVSIHHTWMNRLSLSLGQTISVTFLENGASSHAGKTIQELYPDMEPTTQTDFTPTPTAAMREAVRMLPKKRDKFSLRLAISSGTLFAGETADDEHGFGFSILWDAFYPDRARVSLHSYTLPDIEQRAPLNKHVEERIGYGDSIRFELAV